MGAVADKDPYVYRVLTIDGGGIRGVFAASFLAEIEDTLGGKLSDHFDLISGTSTGGIIALGLCMGLSAREILGFYENDGPAIFKKRSEEHTSELQSLMRISYAVFCLKKKKQRQYQYTHTVPKLAL